MSSAAKQHSPGFLALVSKVKEHVCEINIDQYKDLLNAGKAGQLVDVREDNEWETARAKGAIHMSKGIIERDIETAFPERDTRLVLYCGGGYRSALAAYNLTQMGYTNILSLDGGWRAIEVSGLPLETASR